MKRLFAHPTGDRSVNQLEYDTGYNFFTNIPLDLQETIENNSSIGLLPAAAKSEANSKYDLLTTVLHEMAHLYGFIEGYSGFDRLVSSGWEEVVFNGEHLDKEAHLTI